MKNTVSRAGLLTAVLLLSSVQSARAADYYVNSTAGSNTNSGTSAAAPWRDFTNVNTHTFAAGDNLYLAGGSTWNQELDVHGGGSSWTSPLTLTSYGSGARPKIQRNSAANDRTIKLINPDYVLISGLEICNAGDGIQARWTSLGHQGLRFTNLFIHDIALVYNHTPATTDNIEYSFGIDLQNDPSFTTLPTSSQWLCKDIQITKCQFANVTACWGTFDQYNLPGIFDTPFSFQDVIVSGCWAHDCPADIAVVDATNVLIAGNYFNHLATMALPQGTTAIFQWRTEGVTYLNNVMDGVPSTSSPDQCFIDIEGYANNSYLISNFVTDTAGPGFEWLQLTAGSNPPRNPASDHNTNNNVWSNAFINNAGYALRAFSASGNTITGSIWDNIYYEPATGFTTGSFTGFPVAANQIAAASAASIYSVAYQFSPTTQGAHQWRYQYWNGSSWNDCAVFIGTPGVWDGGTAYAWADNHNGQVGQFTLLPDSTSSYWVAQSWVAPTTGTISIRGRVYLTDSAGGSGVTALIYQNGATNRQLWPSTTGAQSLAGTYASRGFDTTVDSIAVTAGDVIHFSVGTSSGTNAHDTVGWMPIITYR
jgi:hypothetical protein